MKVSCPNCLETLYEGNAKDYLEGETVYHKCKWYKSFFVLKNPNTIIFMLGVFLMGWFHIHIEDWYSFIVFFSCWIGVFIADDLFKWGLNKI